LVKTEHLWTIVHQFLRDVPKRPNMSTIGKFRNFQLLDKTVQNWTKWNIDCK